MAAEVEQTTTAEDLVYVCCRVFVLQAGSSLVRLHLLACAVEPACSRQTGFLLVEAKRRCGPV